MVKPYTSVIMSLQEVINDGCFKKAKDDDVIGVVANESYTKKEFMIMAMTYKDGVLMQGKLGNMLKPFVEDDGVSL